MIEQSEAGLQVIFQNVATWKLLLPKVLAEKSNIKLKKQDFKNKLSCNFSGKKKKIFLKKFAMSWAVTCAVKGIGMSEKGNKHLNSITEEQVKQRLRFFSVSCGHYRGQMRMEVKEWQQNYGDGMPTCTVG